MSTSENAREDANLLNGNSCPPQDGPQFHRQCRILTKIAMVAVAAGVVVTLFAYGGRDKQKAVMLDAIESELSAAGMVAKIFANGGRDKQRAVMLDAIKLSEHYTEFGTAPHEMTVSGSKCSPSVNGEYTVFNIDKETGRPNYVKSVKKGKIAILLSFHHHSKKYTHLGAWKFQELRKERGNISVKNLMGLLMWSHETDKETCIKMPFCSTEKAGAIPPSRHKWKALACPPHGRYGPIQEIRIKGGGVGKPIKVHGEWQFLRTAMPKEQVTIKHGKSQLTSDGGEWEVHGSTSVTMGGTVGFPVFGPSAATEVSVEIGGHYRHNWVRETETNTQQETTFALPADEGSALWQWKLVATNEAGVEGNVLTKQFAFTPSGTREGRPKCYPGGSEDKFRYQKCSIGWEIP